MERGSQLQVGPIMNASLRTRVFPARSAAAANRRRDAILFLARVSTLISLGLQRIHSRGGAIRYQGIQPRFNARCDIDRRLPLERRFQENPAYRNSSFQLRSLSSEVRLVARSQSPATNSSQHSAPERRRCHILQNHAGHVACCRDRCRAVPIAITSNIEQTRARPSIQRQSTEHDCASRWRTPSVFDFC